MGRRAINNAKLIEALLLAPTIEDAARRAKVSVRTMYNRLQNPEFKRAYNDRRRDLVEISLGRLEKSLDRAIHTLNKNMGCGRASDENTAAKAVIDYVLSAREQQEITRRLDALEETLSETID